MILMDFRRTKFVVTKNHILFTAAFNEMLSFENVVQCTGLPPTAYVDAAAHVRQIAK